MDTQIISVMYRRMMIGLSPLFILVGIGYCVDAGDIYYTWFNSYSGIYFIAAIAVPVVWVIRSHPELLLTSSLCLPISQLLFFGFGSLVYVFGNEETIYHLSRIKLGLNEEDFFNANLLSFTGVFLVFSGFYLHTVLNKKQWDIPEGGAYTFRSVVTDKSIKFATWLLLLGMIAKYGLIKPSEWGFIRIVLPSFAQYLIHLPNFVFFFLYYGYTLINVRFGYKMLTVALYMVHIYLSLLSFSKNELISALIFPFIGIYLGHRKNVLVNISLVVVIIATFSLTQNLVSSARSVISMESGDILHATYTRRHQIFLEYIVNPAQRQGFDSDVQKWWLRLSFTGLQSIAMKAYDSGRPGDTLGNVLILFIPRVIWWDKPLIEGPGKAFYHYITGRYSDTLVALSVYGDLYWQFGWIGVFVLCPIIGWYYGCISWRSLRVIYAKKWAYAPLLVYSMYVALLGLNGYLINGIIASIPVYYGLLLILFFLARMQSKKHGRGLIVKN